MQRVVGLFLWGVEFALQKTTLVDVHLYSRPLVALLQLTGCGTVFLCRPPDRS